MDNEFWKIKMEELGIKEEVINELMNEIWNNKGLTLSKPFIDLSKDNVVELQNEFNKTPKEDIKKRAQIMARIISAKIDE